MKFKRAGIITRIVIFALIIYAVVSLINIRSKTESARAQTAVLEEQVTHLQEANAELQYGIDHAGDDETIEDIAREKLGLVKPGEVIFYDVGN